jgi:4-carboxymuconolactone decarboxylase
MAGPLCVPAIVAASAGGHNRAACRGPIAVPVSAGKTHTEQVCREEIAVFYRAIALSLALAAPVSAVRAQDRMPPIPPADYTAAQKKAAADFAAERGFAVRGPFLPLMRSPEVMLRAAAMGDFLRNKTTLAPRLSEMIILITAREWTQQYEWVAHHDIAVKAGLNPAIADAIADGRRPTGMDAQEEAVYDMSTEIHRTKRVSDETYRKAIAQFGEQGVIELLGINGYYTFLAITLNATRAGLPAGVAEPLKRFPD